MVQRRQGQIADGTGRRLDEPDAAGEELENVAAVLKGPAVIAEQGSVDTLRTAIAVAALDLYG
jgi:hypothetical protein